MMNNESPQRGRHDGLMRCVMLSFLLLTACREHTSAQEKTWHTYVIHPETVHSTLFFTGIVQPMKEYTLTSPVDAVVETMPVHYGQQIHANQMVFVLNSAELQKQYNETLTDYLKAKDNFNVMKAKFVGTEDLWHAGLLSKNNYLSETSSLNTARMSLMQATRKLSDMLEKMGDVREEDVSTLSFSAFDKVRAALAGKHNLIRLKSPAEGVLLYPPKSNEDKAGHITVGSAVKSGQVLALVGDLRGIRVEIDVPEVDIDKVKVGMPATIRGVAFGQKQLKGTLTTINAEASVGNAGSMPSFTATVEVRALDAHQRAWIKVGMSASIEVTVDMLTKLMVPIEAVTQVHGHSVVNVRSAKGEVTSRQVITGAAQADRVVIDSGLGVGDVVIY